MLFRSVSGTIRSYAVSFSRSQLFGTAESGWLVGELDRAV